MTNKKKFSNASCYVFGLVLNGDGSGTKATEAEVDGKPLWLHIDYSEDDSVPWLRGLGVPETVIDSLVRLDSRPRAMAVGEGLMLILRGVNANPGERPEDMVSIRFWLEKDRLISVRQRKVFSAQDIKTELEKGIGPCTIQDLITHFIEKLADRIADYVDDMESKITDHEAMIEKSDPLHFRSEVSALRRQAALVRRYLAPQRDALDTFYRQCRNILDEENAYYLHEQSDRIIRYVEDLDLVRERALVLQEELMNLIAQQQNDRMYVLSIVAAIFLPISFVTGLFGMNVAGLPGLDEPAAFMLVSGFMLAVVAIILVLFRIKKWL